MRELHEIIGVREKKEVRAACWYIYCVHFYPITGLAHRLFSIGRRWASVRSRFLSFSQVRRVSCRRAWKNPRVPFPHDARPHVESHHRVMTAPSPITLYARCWNKMNDRENRQSRQLASKQRLRRWLIHFIQFTRVIRQNNCRGM